MANDFDSAVGAVLEIPTEALQKIKSAERSIKRLAEVSQDAAERVSEHWGKTALGGLDKFIQALGKAQTELGKTSTVELNVNTNTAQQNLQSFSNQAEKTQVDFSKIAQQIATTFEDTLGKAPKGFNLIDQSSIEKAVEQLDKLKIQRDKFINADEPKGYASIFGQAGKDITFTRQELNDLIGYTEKLVKAWRATTEAKNEALAKISAKNDKEYLDEQKRQLKDILDLRKQVNEQKLKVAAGEVTQSSTLEQDKKTLVELIQRLYDAKRAYKEYNAETQPQTKVGMDKARIAELDQENKLLKEQRKFQDELNSTIQRRNELVAQPLKARMGSIDEAGIQRQLNTAYKEMTRVIKEQAEVRVKAESEGRRLTQEEINLIATLAQRYKIYYDDVKRVESAYGALSESAARMFAQDKSEQLARNAVMLADAKKKVAEATQKQAEAEAKVVERIEAAREKKFAQQDKKIQQAEQKAAQNYEQWWLKALATKDLKERESARIAEETAKATEAAAKAAAEAQRRAYEQRVAEDPVRIANARANVEKQVNDILNQRIELQQKITALNTKQSIAALSNPKATLNFSDTVNLAKYEKQMADLEKRLKEVSVLFPKLRKESNEAFNNEKANLLALSLQKIAEEQAKISSGSSSSKASDAVTQLNRLYEERLRLLKEKEQLENKSTLASMQGSNVSFTAKENQLLTEVEAKLKTVDNQIANIGNTYAGLAARAKQAFALDELRQSIKLTNDFNNAVDRINTNRAKQLTSEYKKLTKEAQSLAQAMREYIAAGGDRNATAFQQLESQFRNVMQQRRLIEMENIDEVNNYRQQRQIASYQADLSAFVQNEAQKRAEIQKTLDEQVLKAKLAGQQYAQSFQGAMTQFNKLMDDNNTSAKFVMNLENVKRILNDLKTASGKLNILDPNDAQKAERIKKAIEQLTKILNKYKEVASDKIEPTFASAQQAVATARATKSLQDYKRAYDELKAVMSKMDSSSLQFIKMSKDAQEMKRHIDQINKSMGEFKGQTRQSTDLMNQLGNRIGAAFSVAAISGFIKKVVETRAQFELQRVALGAILQDSEKANKTFLQVQQMALQSPFSIMQLERATKQVAAFGFEADKLLPTMKMLADMSAGLGVEIDRLVLVMGHLKARNYLEGTMVRQFTNAGFNVLGELAKYYSELEGKMVSVAEVQARVKKKMVEFGDVEEVLKRVTSAGGMFYDMQKKQSDSIWGQMQRITDAYDLMLNEIGKDNQSMISKALSAVRELINHWRILAPTIKTVGYAMAAVFAAKGLQALIFGFTKLGRLLIKLPVLLRLITMNIKTMNLAWSTTGLGALVALATTAISVFAGLRAEANALNEELEHVGEESVKNLNNMIADYMRLASVVSDSTKTYTEQEEALKDIKRIYAELLPDYMKEREYIQGLNGDYQEVIDTLSKYYQAKEYQQKYETIMASQQAKDVRSEMEEALLKANKEGGLGLLFPESQVKAWSEKLSQELLSGKIANSIDSLSERFKEMFPTATDMPDFSKVIRDNKEVQDSVEGIALASSNAANAVDAYYLSQQRGDSAQQIQDRLEKVQQQYKDTQEFIEKYSDMPDLVAKGQAQLATLTTELNSLAEARSKVIAQEFKDVVEEETKRLTDEVKAWWENKIAMEDAVKQGKNVGKTWDEMVKKDEDLRKSLKGLEDEFELVENDLGEKLPWSMLESAETTYELETAIDKISKDAFPHVAKVAKEKMKEVLKAFLETKGGVLSFLKSIYDVLPDTLKGLVPDVGAMLEANEAELAALRGEMEKTSEKAEDAGKSLKQVYSEVALKNAQKYGATMQRVNTLIGDGTKTRAEMAKEFHQEAEQLKESIKSFDEATDQTAWLEAEGKKISEIEQWRKDAEAYAATAKDLGYTDNKNKGKGKDEILDLWKNRLKAVEDFYKRYDELRKHYDTTESLDRDRKAFTDLFKTLRLNMEQIIAEGMDKQGLANNLKRMTEEVAKVRPQLVDEFQKAFADTQIQVDFKLKEDSEDELKRQIDEMFNTYELGKEFTGLGLPVELTMMLGKEPIKSPEELRNLLQKGFEDAGGDKAAENIVKAYKDAFNKVDDIIFKNQKEQIKNYNKYLIESMGERVQIELKAMQDINKIREDANLDAFSKEQAIIQRRKQMNEDLNKFDFDQLKASDIYINTFKDLENASKQSLQYVINKLKELQSVNQNLSPSQVRALANEMKKAQDMLNKKTALPDFIQNLKKGVEYVKNRKELEEQQINIQKTIEAQQSMLNSSLKRLFELEIQRNSILDKNSEEWKNANAEVERQQQLVKALQEALEKLQEQEQKVNDNIQEGQDAWSGMQEGIKQVIEYIEALRSAFNSIFEGLDAMGLVNDAFRDVAESVNEITDGLTTMLEGLASIDFTNPVSLITGIGKTIGGLFKTIGAIFGIGDKKKEREIKRLQKSVEELDKAYQKLEKSIEDAFTFDQYNAGYKQAQENLKKQKKAYEDMIRLEEAKKKTDNDKIKEYYDALDEIAEKEEELRRQRIEAMGSTTDYLSEAQSFVDAWLNAYKETGNGLDALSESWEEFIENLFVKQAAAQIVSTKLKSVIDDINKAIEGQKTDFDLKEAVNKAREDWAKYSKNIEPILEDLFGAYGLGKGAGEYLLSDLQKGIQNITEPQAAAIESYLNSMRFAVFRHTEQLDILITTIQAQYGAGESPILQEVRLIRSVVESINTQLSRVIVSKNANTNYVLKVG